MIPCTGCLGPEFQKVDLECSLEIFITIRMSLIFSILVFSPRYKRTDELTVKYLSYIHVQIYKWLKWKKKNFFESASTVHLNRENLWTNSSWDFDSVIGTVDPYWFVRDEYSFSRTSLSRWRCNNLQQLFQNVIKMKNRQHLHPKKNFC